MNASSAAFSDHEFIDADALERRFRALLPAVEFCSLRVVASRAESLSVRRDVAQPPRFVDDLGAMVTVFDGGLGYAATPDLSDAGLTRAVAAARRWARHSADGLIGADMLDRAAPRGRYETPRQRPWQSLSPADKFALLRELSGRLRADPRIQDWSAGLWRQSDHTLYLSGDGARVEQRTERLLPSLSATAVERGGDAQTRTLGGDAYLRQGGLEILDDVRFRDEPERIAAEALALLSAADCPDQRRDLLLAPDQMVLQIHESIGHPLELDRILGDERNYAGTSFVSADMFGHYRYGSELLNVTFDPTLAGEAAGYAFDDDGSPALREYLIRDGVLLRPLGGRQSSLRAGFEPRIANSRACGWNRPPIDRMANLNVEPGEQNLRDMIAATERGVLMETNRSWSIDDSRNKFQFGCEYARLIDDGELGAVVKNPNYRGVSAEFWRGLIGVGGRDEVVTLGTPYCGKGEPNQAVSVGHASPPCLFQDVAVFGGV